MRHQVQRFLIIEKTEQPLFIQYLFKKRLTPNEVHKDMLTTLGESAPSYTTVKKWVAEFKLGRESIEDDPCTGWPTTSTIEENFAKVCDLIMGDRRLTIREIAETMANSYEWTQNIIANELGFSKVPARWVPRLLSVE
jgi:hypothetical protein